MALLSQVGSILKQSIAQNSAPCMLNSARYMSTKLFISGIAYSIDDPTLKEAFSQFGLVKSAKIVTDRDTGSSKGFGFVEFADVESAQTALAMDGEDINGRNLHVSIANERPPALSGGYGGGGGRGGGGRGGGRGRGGGGRY